MRRPFLLIHGGSHGSWCWQALKRELESRGATVSAPDLPGHGADPTPRQTVNRDSYLSAVRAEIESIDCHDLTLVGHSLAGILLPELADQYAARLNQVVFLAAMVCKPGQRAIDLFPQERQQAYLDIAEASDDYSVTWPFEKARSVFFNDLTEEQAHWAYDQLTPQPLKVYFDPIPENVPGCPTRYLICQRDQCLTREWCQEWAARLGVEPDFIDSGHDVMLSHPSELADQLMNG